MGNTINIKNDFIKNTKSLSVSAIITYLLLKQETFFSLHNMGWLNNINQFSINEVFDLKLSVGFTVIFLMFGFVSLCYANLIKTTDDIRYCTDMINSKIGFKLFCIEIKNLNHLINPKVACWLYYKICCLCILKTNIGVMGTFIGIMVFLFEKTAAPLDLLVSIILCAYALSFFPNYLKIQILRVFHRRSIQLSTL